jgi:hypothetical protein
MAFWLFVYFLSCLPGLIEALEIVPKNIVLVPDSKWEDPVGFLAIGTLLFVIPVAIFILAPWLVRLLCRGIESSPVHFGAPLINLYRLGLVLIAGCIILNTLGSFIWHLYIWVKSGASFDVLFARTSIEGMNVVASLAVIFTSGKISRWLVHRDELVDKDTPARQPE